MGFSPKKFKFSFSPGLSSFKNILSKIQSLYIFFLTSLTNLPTIFWALLPPVIFLTFFGYLFIIILLFFVGTQKWVTTPSKRSWQDESNATKKGYQQWLEWVIFSTKGKWVTLYLWATSVVNSCYHWWPSLVSLDLYRWDLFYGVRFIIIRASACLRDLFLFFFSLLSPPIAYLIFFLIGFCFSKKIVKLSTRNITQH